MERAAEYLRPSIAVITAVLPFVGVLFFWWSMQYLKPDARVADIFKFKRWWPSMVRLQPLFRPRGFGLLYTAWMCVVASVVWRFMFLGWNNWWWMP